MDDETIKKGTRLCYKKNENGYAWVTVTDHTDAMITYIREGKSVTVPDTVLDTRLFGTLQEARAKGLILDVYYEDSAAVKPSGELKELDYLLGENGFRRGHALDSSLLKNISDYVDQNLIIKAKIKRFAAERASAFRNERKAEAEQRKAEEESQRRSIDRRTASHIKDKAEKEPENKPVAQGQTSPIGEAEPTTSPSSNHFDFGPGLSADHPSPFMELDDDGELPFDLTVRHQGAASSVPIRIKKLDATFGETLLKLIEEKNMKNSEFYNLANISKQLFYRITTQTDRPPRKNIALACALALKLDLNETKDLLEKAGYALSHSNITDVIVEAFIAAKHYDIFDVNEYLYEYDGDLLGSDMR